jgi:hypothetical protein
VNASLDRRATDVKLHPPTKVTDAEASLNSPFSSFFLLILHFCSPTSWNATALLYIVSNARLSQHFLLTCFPVLFAIMANPEYPSHHVRNKLYTSHFLSTWNSRLFEFGAVLFISTIFPGTLFPASIYALTRSASVVVFSTAIGHLIDHSERIFLIRLSISKLSSLVNAIFLLPLDASYCPCLYQTGLTCPSFHLDLDQSN